MASISLRGRTWRAEVYRKGERITGSFDTEAEARVWATKTEARLDAKVTKAQIRQTPTNVSTAALFDQYALEVSPGKRGGRWELIRLLALSRHPVFQGIAADLDGAALAEWRDERLRSVKASTVNRDLNLVSAVFTRAMKEWRLPLNRNPVSDLMRPPQPRGRDRLVSEDERALIVRELCWDGETAPSDLMQWTAWAFCFALETGMRQGEILAIRRQHLHQTWVHLPLTKNGDSRDVPLSTRALALLALLPDVGDRLVPLSSGTCGAYFREAARRAGVAGITFHDSRHAAATAMAEKLTALELARVLGHRDLRATAGYYNQKASALAGKLG